MVDPYDDTIFNRLQMQRIVSELTQLRHSATSDEAEAATHLLVLTQAVDAKRHRYLVFVSD